MIDVETTFTYHSPKGDQPKRYERIRAKARELAELYLIDTPPSREQSIALTNLEQSVMWANKAIAVNEAERERFDGRV
jgi:hypothetical protein